MHIRDFEDELKNFVVNRLGVCF